MKRLNLFMTFFLIPLLILSFSCGEDNKSPTEPSDKTLDKIAFCSDRDGNWEIYVIDLIDSTITKLTDNSANDRLPKLSPDDTQIAFSTNRDGNYEIYVMNADGTNPHNLTQNPAHEEYCTWSPDGTQIAFNTYRDGNSEIYIMNTDGSGQTRKTFTSVDDGKPCWSPDGTKIALSRVTTPEQSIGHWQLFVMNADGTNEYRLTDNNYDNGDPAWSPDGSKIAFESTLEGDWSRGQIFVGDFEEVSGEPRLSNIRNITNNENRNGSPRWSPDGNQIVFRKCTAGTWNCHIWVMDSDGTNPTPLADTPGANYTGPDW